MRRQAPTRGDRTPGLRGRGAAPAVSVLLPVYDQAGLLGRAVESVLAQTLAGWELVIADDGSADASAEVAAAFAARDRRVRLLRLRHRGLAAAWNAAAAAARAPLLARLDADDLYRPRHLADNLAWLAAHPEVDLVMSRAELLGDPWVVDLERPGRMIHLDRCAIGGTFLVRRPAFEAVGGVPDSGFGLDYHFARAVAAAGFRVARRRVRTYVYDRTRDGSMSKQAEERMRAGAEPG